MIKKFTAFIISSTLLLVFLPAFISAQTSPTTQPLVQQADMVYLGKITAPPTDGTGRGNSMDSLDYGAFGLGMGADGKSLYFGCHDWHDQIARISIPAIGQQASILMPCTPINNKLAINPGDPNGYNPGGMLVWNGKLIATMYPYYDASQSALGSHFSMSTDMTSQTGPFRLYPGPDSPTNRVGMVSGYMGIIPQEWRSLLGGPAMSGQMGIPIIGRTSFGPTATVFDPDQIGQGSSASKMLLGYPNEHQTLGGYSQSNPLFAGSDQVGGMAFPDGTRSVLFVGRHAASFCYGYGTSNQALHGTVDSAGVMYCYDPTSTSKGTHGYPYIHQVWAYDANDLLAVKNGTKQPWDLRPYATWKITDINNDGSAGAIMSATYDPATKRFYMATGRNIHVYQVNIGTIAPPPVPDTTSPVVSISSPSSGANVSGSSVTVSANATDNIGVAGVQFKVDGVNVGSEDFTSPYSINWDTTNLSNGNHSITAVARDAAGNTATASSVTVNVVNTTPPPPQTSPVGHWMFESTSGTTALDSSVNSNNGTLLNGPVWTTGKIGNALSFDGIDDYVNIGNPSSLALGSRVTLAGWVNLADNSVARMLISKDDGQSNPTFIRTQGSSVRCAIGGTVVGDFGVVGTNTWNHVACTYDGASVTLYLNGVSVGSISKTGSIADNSGNWNIGSRVNGGAMLMRGMLDDVRVYNRALTSSEIMALATSNSGTDTTAPTVSMSAPANGSTVSGTVSMSANATDNVGVAGVQFRLDGANFGSDLTYPYSISWDTSYSTNGSHNISAEARDAVGNAGYSTQILVNVNNSISTKFVIGDTVKTIANVNVRETASVTGTLLGTQATGLLGKVVAGPTSSGGFTWWKVDYNSGPDGWSTEDYLVKYTADDILSDTVAPSVKITAPETMTTVAGIPVFISADATDNVGVVGVQFKLDGVNISSEDTSAPYGVIWDTTNASEGSHLLTAEARDAAGNKATSVSVAVTVTKVADTDTTSPTVSLTAPASNVEVRDSVNVSASASDNVGVIGVQFKLDGADLLSEDTVSPFSVVWNTKTVSNGEHTLTAVARDAAGNKTTSTGVVVRVGNDDVSVYPPSVTLTSPAANAEVWGTISINANASDNVGVAGVQFKLNGVNLLTEDSVSPYTISWNSKAVSNGTHTLTATARDVEGNQTTSSVVSVRVANDEPEITPTPTLKIGDKIKTTAWINVRSTAGGKSIGTQRTGKTGTITAGPGSANSLTWWKVNFSSGADGWVAAKYITKSTVAMTEDDYRKNIANIYLIIKYLQERLTGQN